MRLRVVESNNITRTHVTGCDVLYRHVPTVGACRMTFPTSDSRRVAQRDQ